MFQFDTLAREAVELFSSSDSLAGIRPIMKIFAYMPLVHHENLESQIRCKETSEKILNGPDLDETERKFITESIEYTKIHLDIIKKFGRFPHRNFLLNRTSTPQEIEFLKMGHTFGVKQG
jgi:uncharacterized protein (DUF924 family)